MTTPNPTTADLCKQARDRADLIEREPQRRVAATVALLRALAARLEAAERERGEWRDSMRGAVAEFGEDENLAMNPLSAREALRRAFSRYTARIRDLEAKVEAAGYVRDNLVALVAERDHTIHDLEAKVRLRDALAEAAEAHYKAHEYDHGRDGDGEGCTFCGLGDAVFAYRKAGADDSGDAVEGSPSS